MKTSFPKPAEPKWHLVDASEYTVGRLAARLATILRGKHKASFVPHLMSGDHVVVVNAERVKLTGAKETDKTYYRHTGYFGHLRETKAERMREERPTQIIRLAVKGMLPKNPTRERLLKRLHVYVGEEHDQKTHNPVPLPPLK